MQRIPFATLILLVALGCATTSRPSGQVAAVQEVLAADSDLGAARNHAPETGPLSAAIRDYVTGLNAIDYSACPDEFADAFARHSQAWDDAIPFFAQFDDLRGEMHVLFEQIRSQGGQTKAQLEAHEAEIWGTWSEVEDAARGAGALDAPA